MSDDHLRNPVAGSLRERRRNRIRAPFGDEDIPIVFAGAGGLEAFHRRLGSTRRTAFLFDDRMLLHKNEWYASYPECPERQTAIIQRCEACGILRRCLLVSVEPATDDFLGYIHKNAHISQVMKTESMTEENRLSLSGSLDSAYFNQHTALAARLAVGSVLQAVDLVHRGDVRNGFCLVRPPGHHAMEDEACGFCIFNNVAIAARYALDRLGYNRILILDWDVHHGQATQYAFYDSSQVLYISIHRYDNQQFWPCLRESNYDFIGSGHGRGFNINVALNESGLGDADYLAIFHQLVLPVAYEYDPDLILISAGYDCAFGCPLGQMEVSPPLFAHLTHKLMCLAEGRLIVALEGGYFHDSLAESVAHTVSALLGDPPPSLDALREVSPSVLKSIADCVSVLQPHWRCLQLFQTLGTDVDTTELTDQTWKLVKVPATDPEPHLHNPEDATRIDQWLTRVKRCHPVVQLIPPYTTCLVYDSRMENHKNEEDRTHPESPHRIRRAFELLDEYGLARRCKRVEARFASRAELSRVHTESYIDYLAGTAGLEQSALDEMSDDIASVYFNRHTYDCARLAAGSVLAVIDEICTGQTLNGLALVRPPGHHALADRAMGFCFFNNVALGARHAQHVHGLTKIAIVDWDVHHGNGTAKIFENDPNVLYISVHRYDDGRFFPGIAASSPSACGMDEGLGQTVQVGWIGRHIRDGEYIAVFTHLILPILYEFRPQLILVSAGYDAVRGDRLGGLGVTPECFAHLTHLLLTVANLHSVHDPETSGGASMDSHSQPCPGQDQNTPKPNRSGGLALVLEGGYNLSAMAESVCHSVASLLGDSCPRLANASPTERGFKAIRKALHIQQEYWKSIQGYGAVRSHVVPDGSSPFSDNQLRVGAHSALAFTGQLEALLQSRLAELNIIDDPPPGISPPAQQPASPPISISATDSNPNVMGSVSSTSLPTRAVATCATAVTEQTAETLHDSGTELFSSRLSASGGGPAASISVVHSSSVVENAAQLADELSRLQVSSPFTVISEPPSSASDLSATTHHRPVQSNVTGAFLPRANTAATPRTQVVGVATLQDLMHVTSFDLDDIHSFFGLESAHQLPDQLFAVVPLTWCPHLSAVRSNPEWIPDVNTLCTLCDHRTENWVCLTCYAVYCGRYANSHMLSHFNVDKHPLVLSFADLSSWCYECEAYVHHEALFEVKRAAHRAKFGSDSA